MGCAQLVHNYTIGAQLRNWCAITQLVRNYTISAQLHNWCAITQLVRNYTIGAQLHNWCTITQFCDIGRHIYCRLDVMSLTHMHRLAET